tara:strand:+ start:159 stop:572 length:414 start_codon:yes stop_codon:yes gene_type:complete
MRAPIFSVLLACFIVIPLIELALLFRVGDRVGPGATVAIVILTGIVGASLARAQGARVIADIQQAAAVGQMPAPYLLDGLMILIAGVLLITPGLLTDGVGFLLLVPIVRREVRAWLKVKLERKLRDGSLNLRFGPPS